MFKKGNIEEAIYTGEGRLIVLLLCEFKERVNLFVRKYSIKKYFRNGSLEGAI